VRRVISIAALVIAFPVVAAAQSAAPSSPPSSDRMTRRERVDWVMAGNLGGASLAAGVFVSAWQIAWDTPDEWDRDFGGFVQRYMEREAHIVVSNSIEAALGAAWNEDPRYHRSASGAIGSRVGHAVRSAFVARRGTRDAPAWARYVAVPAGVGIENSWLPPSVTTPQATSWRIGSAFIGRAVGNVWTEFWPDVRARLRR
jgi:hypothetical protein